MGDHYEAESTPWRDEGTIRELYVERGWTLKEVGEELGCTSQTVRKWVDKHDIQQPVPPWQDETTLRELRSDGLSHAEIGHQLGCSSKTIGNWLDAFGMDTSRQTTDQPWHSESRLRELYIKQELTIQETATELGCHWLTVRDWLDKHCIETRSRNPEPPEELLDAATLRGLYRTEGLSTYEIANQLGCAASTVHDYLRTHGIETRSVGSQTGELHHRWNGGFEPYYGKNWHEVRRRVLNRDNRTCQCCGVSEVEHKEQHGMQLDVHHRKPIRTFDEPEAANDPDNLVTLCRQCHNRVETEGKTA
jgi:5-methylcytosine-specific restriction endonuclease McrA/biotin operon repressor